MSTRHGFRTAAGAALAAVAAGSLAVAADRPPLDLRRPARTERAVFALG